MLADTDHEHAFTIPGSPCGACAVRAHTVPAFLISHRFRLVRPGSAGSSSPVRGGGRESHRGREDEARIL